MDIRINIIGRLYCILIKNGYRLMLSHRLDRDLE